MSFIKVALNLELKSFEENQKEELIQRTAWRLVRSTADRFGDGKGEKKLEWAKTRLVKEFPELIEESAEDYIRAAYVNYKTERGS